MDDSTRGYGCTSMECRVGCTKGPCPQGSHAFSLAYSRVCAMVRNNESHPIRTQGWGGWWGRGWGGGRRGGGGWGRDKYGGRGYHICRGCSTNYIANRSIHIILIQGYSSSNRYLRYT